MSYFITGTDTGVGKTLVSCALLHAFAAQGKRVVGFKPVAAGCDDNYHNDDAQRLLLASNVLASYGQVNPYCFVHPVAPHIAARDSGVRIEMSRILTSYHELASQSDEVIVEGAGGFLVPLNEKKDSADLASLADEDAGDWKRYPGFEAWYDVLKTTLSKDDVRIFLRRSLRDRVAEARGKEFVTDLTDDVQLQRAALEAVKRSGTDPKTLPEYASFAEKVERAELEKKDPSKEAAPSK